MESNNELKEIILKTVRVIILMIYWELQILLLTMFYWTKDSMKIRMKIFWFMTFHIKLLWVQNHCALGSITIYDCTRYLALFGPGIYDVTYDVS